MFIVGKEFAVPMCCPVGLKALGVAVLGCHSVYSFWLEVDVNHSPIS